MARMNITPRSSSLVRVEPFQGINQSVTPSQIQNGQSPDMLNFYVGKTGDLVKRTGFTKAFPTSLGTGKINGVYQFVKDDGTTKNILAYGTSLYTWDKDTQPTEILSGIANAEAYFFTMNDKCYIIDGTYFIEYDGTNAKKLFLENVYKPMITISNSPTGGGVAHEDLNLLGNGFKESFSGDGTSTVYHLSFRNLDSYVVTVWVNDIAYVETTSSAFTVDRTEGTVTFENPPSSGTNNVIIQAFKTFSGFDSRIKKCKFSVIYGGSNDTRVFLSGNPDHPNIVRMSGLYDPTYWPENGFYKFPDNVKGFTKQYDTLIIERTNGKHQVTFELNNGEASFPSKPLNDEVGTLAEKSIQLIENNPVSLSRNGVYMLLSSNVRDERNVQHLSLNIDPKLLNEPNLEKAVSIDYDRKYWLAVNGNVYLFDYDVNEWFMFDNIHAYDFIEIDRELYFTSDNGMIYRFKKESDNQPFNDDGAAIKAYWYSKQMTFNADEMTKLVEKIFFAMKPYSHSSASLYYITNKKESDLVTQKRIDSLDFRNMDFTNFSFLTTDFPQEVVSKIKAKKITHFQVLFKNEEVNEGLGITSLGVKYRMQSEVR